MNLLDNNADLRKNIRTNYAYTTKAANPGFNGITGFKEWECYMIVKYGKNGKFGVGGDYEYLIELPLYPQQVTESISPQWEQQKVLGRSAPLSAYANTDLKQVSFSLDLHRDFLTGSFSHSNDTLKAVRPNMSEEELLKRQAAGLQLQTEKGPFFTRSWYTSINKMLQISCYPQYTKIGMIPPTTYFIFGQMILKGFVSSYQTEWKKPIINSFYGWNSVSISMLCYPDGIISAKDMITNARAGTASTQNTYNTAFPDNVGSSNVMTRDDTTNRTNSRVTTSIGGTVRDT